MSDLDKPIANGARLKVFIIALVTVIYCTYRKKSIGKRNNLQGASAKVVTSIELWEKRDEDVVVLTCMFWSATKLKVMNLLKYNALPPYIKQKHCGKHKKADYSSLTLFSKSSK